MSTRATIAQIKDDKLYFITCHYDGYYKATGVILERNYDTTSKVESLINNGSLMVLGGSIESSIKLNKSYIQSDLRSVNIYDIINDRYIDTEDENGFLELSADLFQNDHIYIWVDKLNKWFHFYCKSQTIIKNFLKTHCLHA